MTCAYRKFNPAVSAQCNIPISWLACSNFIFLKIIYFKVFAVDGIDIGIIN